jgi:cysteinyl-tRNA synthetase
MSLQLFNTRFRRKEEFKSIATDNSVSMYCCGPTVYNYAHIGNMRTYIFEDFLRRILEYNGYTVNHVMNITDVGHLSDDGDEGEDKMEKGARREGKTVWEVAKAYTNSFFEDAAKLSILMPSTVCKATEHIQEMIDMIQTLEKKGFTYTSEGNVYFDISKFTYYRDLGRLNLEEMQSTERVSEDTGKKNPHDFVLWFTNSKFDNHAMQWDSPWGSGYPGWHIECSAMSTKYLGDEFDIHCGGVDHIQVHHTNEIAQSECAIDKHPQVNFWLHGEFLLIDNGRMAKSEGNFIQISSFEEKGFNPLIFRYFCMSASYRQQLNFSWDIMDNANKGFEALLSKITELKKLIPGHIEGGKLPDIPYEDNDAVLAFKEKFLEAINDDLNMPAGMAVVHEVLKSDLEPAEKLYIVYDYDLVLGLNLENTVFDKTASEEDTSDIKELLDARALARESKDFESSDALRDEIAAKGFIVKDTPEGQVVEKV